MPTTHDYKISKYLLPTNKQGGTMNTLGDTSTNNRNLLKQGLGVNLYPLPFAKGGTLPKAQKGKRTYSPDELRKAEAIAKAELRKPWLRRQLERPQSQATKIFSLVDPTGISNWNPLYRKYKEGIQEGKTPLGAAGNAAIMEGLGALPLFGAASWKGLAKNPLKAILGKAPQEGNIPSAVGNMIGQVGGTGVDLMKAAAGATEESLAGKPVGSYEMGLFAKERPDYWPAVRDARQRLRESGYAKQQREFRRKFEYGGSAPKYQMGGEMAQNTMLDEVAVTSPNMSNVNAMSPTAGQNIGYDVQTPNQFPAMSIPQRPVNPQVNSYVMPQPTPSTPAAIGGRSGSMFSAPKKTSGGYRYGAGFGQGRPAAGSITRKPNVRTSFR